MKVFKIFFSDIDKQEKWLNSMAQKKLRLIKTSKLFYYFEETPIKYAYQVQCVFDKNVDELNEYIEFLRETNINVLKKNFAVGSVVHKKRKLDPLSGNIKKDQNYNSELLILEKIDDGNSFQIYSTNKDKLDYYKKVRRYFVSYLLFLLIMSPLLFLGEPRAGFIDSVIFMDLFKYGVIFLFSIAFLLLFITAVKLTMRIKSLMKQNIVE